MLLPILVTIKFLFYTDNQLDTYTSMKNCRWNFSGKWCLQMKICTVSCLVSVSCILAMLQTVDKSFIVPYLNYGSFYLIFVLATAFQTMILPSTTDKFISSCKLGKKWNIMTKAGIVASALRKILKDICSFLYTMHFGEETYNLVITSKKNAPKQTQSWISGLTCGKI